MEIRLSDTKATAEVQKRLEARLSDTKDATTAEVRKHLEIRPSDASLADTNGAVDELPKAAATKIVAVAQADKETRVTDESYCSMVRLSLFAFVGFASAVQQRDMTTANPFRKVVNMLEVFKSKAEGEGEKEKEVYDKHMC